MDEGTTLATIEVTEPDGTTTTVPNITAFSYSSDAQQVGDPFSVGIPDPRLRYIKGHKLAEGARVTFSLSSPFVGSGAKTKKITGVIVRREVSVTESGTVIQIQGADLGWHLIDNDGPLWMGLHGVSFGTLANACIHPDRVLPGETDPGWGFANEVLFENTSNTLAKQHLKQGRQGIIIANQANPEIPLARIQVEPGEKLFDLLSLYAKRFLLFVNVTADGALVVYSPDYSREPSYTFNCYPTDDPLGRQFNNVKAEGIKVIDDITERWTDITCVGEVPLPDELDGVLAQDNQNANKFRGYYQPGPGATVGGLPLPPFLHRLVFGDGEALYRDFATNRAAWKGLHGLFNSHVLTFSVRHHHQRGIWYEANTMCEINFPVAGVSGRYFVSAVRCDRDERGDRTMMTAHKPDLLGA